MSEELGHRLRAVWRSVTAKMRRGWFYLRPRSLSSVDEGVFQGKAPEISVDERIWNNAHIGVWSWRESRQSTDHALAPELREFAEAMREKDILQTGLLDALAASGNLGCVAALIREEGAMEGEHLVMVSKDLSGQSSPHR